MEALKKAEHRQNELEDSVLARAKEGEENACRALVERYYLPVYHLLWRMIENHAGQARVEEVVQDVFVNVFRRLSSFSADGSAKLTTWIFTIATRVALNELRRPRLAVPLEDHHDLADPGGDPESELLERRAVLAIRRAIGDLTPDHRAVFLLREYHGFEYKEISRALDIDIGTVKSRLSRARLLLKEALSEVRDG